MMKLNALLALCLLAPAARATDIPFNGFPPAPKPPLALETSLLQAADGPIIPPETWDGLQPPQPEVLDILAARVPGLDRDKVREATPELAQSLMRRAVERNLSALDLFTDEALRTDRLYYLPGAVLSQIDDAYDLKNLFPLKGRTTNGATFVMQGVVMGGNKIEMLYNFQRFTFIHPLYRDMGGKYTFQSRISQTIQGPGIVSLTGATGPLGAVIRGFEKISDTQVRVLTNLMNQVVPLFPISAR